MMCNLSATDCYHHSLSVSDCVLSYKHQFLTTKAGLQHCQELGSKNRDFGWGVTNRLQPFFQPGVNFAVKETAIFAFENPVVGIREND